MRTPPRILVVDDNPTNLEVLRVRLNAQNYEVVTAVDGEDALVQARELEPDLVLLDVMMPKLDGISVLKQLKQDATLRFVPVILVTAKADTRDIVNGLEAGGDDYLTKPFEHAALVARVRSLLRIKELHDTVQTQAMQLKAQTDQLSSWNQLLEQRVAEQLAEIERIGRLQRFLAPQVAQMIASSDASESLLASHRREVTVLFCDLREFTAFTEASEPEEVMAVLREYHESLGELIFRYEGTLERFLGDGIMIVFNDPIPSPIIPSAPCGWPSICATRWQSWRSIGREWGTRSASESELPLVMRPSVKSGSTSPRIHGHRQCHQSCRASLRRSTARSNRDRTTRIQLDRATAGGLHIGDLNLKGFNRPMAAYEVLSWRDQPPVAPTETTTSDDDRSRQGQST